jgi:hypothetical protein
MGEIAFQLFGSGIVHQIDREATQQPPAATTLLVEVKLSRGSVLPDSYNSRMPGDLYI